MMTRMTSSRRCPWPSAPPRTSPRNERLKRALVLRQRSACRCSSNMLVERSRRCRPRGRARRRGATIQPTLIAARSGQRVVQVVPVEEEASSGRSSARRGRVDPVDRELPVARDRCRSRATTLSPIFQPSFFASTSPTSAPCWSCFQASSCSGGDVDLVVDLEVGRRVDGDASRRTRRSCFGSLPPNQFANVASFTRGALRTSSHVALAAASSRTSPCAGCRRRSFAAYSAADAHAQMTVRSRRKATIATATPAIVSDGAELVPREVARRASPMSVMTRASPCRGAG